jgi:hypothetical protein
MNRESDQRETAQEHEFLTAGLLGDIGSLHRVILSGYVTTSHLMFGRRVWQAWPTGRPDLRFRLSGPASKIPQKIKRVFKSNTRFNYFPLKMRRLGSANR